MKAQTLMYIVVRWELGYMTDEEFAACVEAIDPTRWAKNGGKAQVVAQDIKMVWMKA